MTDFSQFIDTREVCARTGLTRRQCYALANSGQVPGVLRYEGEKGERKLYLWNAQQFGDWHRKNVDALTRGAIVRALVQKMLDALGAAPSERNNYVYFARCEEFVKVGLSYNPRYRVSSLSTGSPYEVVLLKAVAGSKAAEQALHELLRPYHHRFEWFRLTDELREAIAQLRGIKDTMPADMINPRNRSIDELLDKWAGEAGTA